MVAGREVQPCFLCGVVLPVSEDTHARLMCDPEQVYGNIWM